MLEVVAVHEEEPAMRGELDRDLHRLARLQAAPPFINFESENLTNGVDMAVEDLGKKGIKVQLVKQDDTGKPQVAMSAMEQLALSARAYHRVLRVARTVAVLAGSETVLAKHVLEAIQFRRVLRAS